MDRIEFSEAVINDEVGDEATIREVPKGKRLPITSAESQTYIDTGELPDADEDDDDGCPKNDPDCMGKNGDCHDACEWPEDNPYTSTRYTDADVDDALEGVRIVISCPNTPETLDVATTLQGSDEVTLSTPDGRRYRLTIDDGELLLAREG
jgi:hypothetical protein